ncbi:MAG: hypothetical protein JW959_11510 [Pirellulales bacterium]|nr:hypothetical protein [Pirellulales bacterium]
MQDMGWKEAIIEVLHGETEPLHYTDITDLIVERQLKTEFGATPAKSVSATITISLNNDGEDSPFIRVGRGHYALRSTLASELEESSSSDYSSSDSDDEDETAEMGLIKAFGMYWKRDAIRWIATPRILGQQQLGASEVDFSGQKGVYLLHDGNRVIYVGRTTDQPFGKRLYQHTTDRLGGRWDRFSWFGIYTVAENGSLQQMDGWCSFSVDNLIATMEALLIEGLEPPQNRKRGDDFRAIEFSQVVDPDIEKLQYTS